MVHRSLGGGAKKLTPNGSTYKQRLSVSINVPDSAVDLLGSPLPRPGHWRVIQSKSWPLKWGGIIPVRERIVSEVGLSPLHHKKRTIREISSI